MGPASGASIDHIHLQIVPRYRTEVGFFDVLSDSRVICEYLDAPAGGGRLFPSAGAARWSASRTCGPSSPAR